MFYSYSIRNKLSDFLTVLPLGRKIPFFRKFGSLEGNKKEMTFSKEIQRI
jgi:hypothetical protein